MNAFLGVLRRDLRLALRQSGDIATLVMFFIITGGLFPFGVGPEPQTLAKLAAGITWVTALLACLLSLDRLFQHEAEDGSLELMALSPAPLGIIVLGKCLGHWLTTGLPLIAASPIMGILLNLPGEAYPVLILALLLGTPSLSLIGAVGAALTLGARRGGGLLALLILPLYIPVLIFGVTAVEAAASGFSSRPQLLLLGGLFLVALTLTPLATAAAIRHALE